MKINRRELAAGAAVTVAAGALNLAKSTPAEAQTVAAPAAGQVAGVYRYKVGDITVTALSDGAFTRKLEEGFVRNAPLAEVQKALSDAYLPTDSLQISFTTLVLESGGKKILIDTGFADNGPPTAGRMFEGLKTAGIEPASIDHVIISHFHGDHIAGLRKKDGSASFPNAEIAVPEAEWAFWTDEARAAAAPEALKGNFAMVNRVFGPVAKDVRRFAWDKEVAPGITAIAAPGHTPGHTTFAVTSGNAKLMVLSDITNVPYLFVRRPDWQVMFDMDGEQARQSRHKLLDMVSSERMQVAGYHFPFPSTGYIAKDGNGYELVPAAWRAAL